ncbi:MAG: winged helix-turn-helix domain-containing protein [Patescibacteria group bacterium]|nr:winged helix-turn-helix domain-containing protein [Patescibacteria group bacterium]
MTTAQTIVKTPFEDVFGSRARVKILKFLAINEELSISQVIELLKLNYTNAKKHLDFLVERDLIHLKVFGRIKIYRFKIENLKARSFKKFLGIWESLSESISDY